jgi:hypothetical protein
MDEVHGTHFIRRIEFLVTLGTTTSTSLHLPKSAKRLNDLLSLTPSSKKEKKKKKKNLTS